MRNDIDQISLSIAYNYCKKPIFPLCRYRLYLMQAHRDLDPLFYRSLRKLRHTTWIMCPNRPCTPIPILTSIKVSRTRQIAVTRKCLRIVFLTTSVVQITMETDKVAAIAVGIHYQWAGAYNINGPHHMNPSTTAALMYMDRNSNLQMRNPQAANSKVSLSNNNFNVNPFSPKKEVRSPKSESKKDAQIITPLPSQDASGISWSWMWLQKIEPPPKVKRTSSRTSQGGQTDLLISPDSCQTMSSRSSTTSDTSFSDKRNSRDSSKIGDDLNANLTSLMSPLSKSNSSSTATSPNHNSGAQSDITTNFSKGSQKFQAMPKQQAQLTANEKECNMNNLSHSPAAGKARIQTTKRLLYRLLTPQPS